MIDYIVTKSFGKVFPRQGINARIPYEHQKDAMHNLDIISKEDSYSTLVVLPTGGGKTYTASLWLLKNALNKNKKVLWIAHRQLLLEQAAESFQKFAYAEIIPNINSFQYRIVSGAKSHARTIDIMPSDQLLIVSKDSIGRNLSALDDWLKGENELFFIIDEAHHSTAKTYRKIIDYIKSKVKVLKIIGLTATPFRTAECEQGLLSNIYKDGVEQNEVVRNKSGITYQISLKELISRGILSKPYFESCHTEESFGENLGLDAWENIERLDHLPEDIAKKIAGSATRNRIIVDRYLERQHEYGQTIVFAVNVIHATTLCQLFKSKGVTAEYIISNEKDKFTGVSCSREDNERKINAFKEGKINVLINVNILTEGIDLPQTKTVFLARPTVSAILMTQMIGRALRGEKAGGTDKAYIVSFIDNWNDHIAWVNPESLFVGNNDFAENSDERVKKQMHMISLAKIEEFALLMDKSLDTTNIEKIPFIQRIPIGMYAFSYLEEDETERACQVMVYDRSSQSYKNMMGALGDLFKSFCSENGYAEEEFLPFDLLKRMAVHCEETFFTGEIIPPFEIRDAISIIKYYAQYGEIPPYYSFDEIDRNKVDISKIARYFWNEDVGPKKQKEYIDELWDRSDNNILQILFGKKHILGELINLEIKKIQNPEMFTDEQNAKYGTIALEDLPLSEIKKVNPDLEKKLRDDAFENAITKYGMYQCACCGATAATRGFFQVDHIIPMNKGGKSIKENLQILCRRCNGTKSDHMPEIVEIEELKTNHGEIERSSDNKKNSGVFHKKVFVLAKLNEEMSEAIKEYIEEQGGKVTKTVSSNTDYVIVGDYKFEKDTQVKNARKLKKEGCKVQVISEATFYKRFF